MVDHWQLHLSPPAHQLTPKQMVNTGAETLALVTVTPSFIILPDSPYMEGPEQASKPGGGGWGGGGRRTR